MAQHGKYTCQNCPFVAEYSKSENSRRKAQRKMNNHKRKNKHG